jgi:multidrug resistance protein MdtO
MHAPVLLERLREDLKPFPGRASDTLRITVSALLVIVVMLAFRMPFLSIGPYLVFILFQRDLFLTRATALAGVLVAGASFIFVYAVAMFSWDVAWLRVTLWGLLFFGGYFLMHVLAEPRLILGPLVVMSLLSFLFDEYPFPNRIISEMGWLWALLGLCISSTFLTQWLFCSPTGREFLREQFREIVLVVEQGCLGRSFGRLPKEMPFEGFSKAIESSEKLGMAGVLSKKQSANCRRLFLAVQEAARAVASQSCNGDIFSKAWHELASQLHWLRVGILSGNLNLSDRKAISDIPPQGETIRHVELVIQDATSRLNETEESSSKVPPSSFLSADWRRNPAHIDFAIRATLATMGCYFFMRLTAWDGIHTCMITCVVTALSSIDAQMRKQNLRIGGAVLGGLLGLGAVIFLIPNTQSLLGLLFILTGATALAAWISLGGERIAYAGWQVALAFYMTVLQAPHPSTKLDSIRDRWVGILLGILAMRAAFIWFAPNTLKQEEWNTCGKNHDGSQTAD